METTKRETWKTARTANNIETGFTPPEDDRVFQTQYCIFSVFFFLFLESQEMCVEQVAMFEQIKKQKMNHQTKMGTIDVKRTIIYSQYNGANKSSQQRTNETTNE